MAAKMMGESLGTIHIEHPQNHEFMPIIRERKGLRRAFLVVKISWSLRLSICLTVMF